MARNREKYDYLYLLCMDGVCMYMCTYVCIEKNDLIWM